MIENIIAAIASSIVAGKRSFSSSVTGRLETIESPRSPDAVFFT